jgi:hypothetical protein
VFRARFRHNPNEQIGPNPTGEAFQMSSHAIEATHARTVDNEKTLDPRVPSRWLLLLGIPFIVGGALFAAGISSGEMWLLLPAAVFGPGAMILGFTYLSLTSDTNRYQ